MEKDLENSLVILNNVKGIEYVRPPILNFIKKKETNDFIDYQIITKKDSKTKSDPKKGCPENPFINFLDSFIFCNPTINIKMPKKNYMIKKDKKKYAYAVGMFPNPKNGKAAYLDGCILAALGLKRQTTNADVICFITHDISKKDKEKLEIVFDKVIYVPYISPYDMGGEGELKTIMINKDIFKNCNGYTKNHPYVHVFFKLHIFNPELFPYEKVCFVDSDLVPLNYYDSLFTLNTPAGFVEYRKKPPYLESYQWDRCDYLEHGKLIPKEITDVDKPTGADVNAGLLLIKPNKKEYDEMIKELSSPIEEWMGPNKKHKGFYHFNFDNPKGTEFVKNSYCFPEQNYLTKRYSGKWTFIEFAFQSWSRDPCNSFGIHMAAFNPKPWFKQPIGTLIKTNEKYQPYLKEWNKKQVRFPLAMIEGTDENYENISFSYEIFNEVIIWGMVNYPELTKFFVHNTQIHGSKVSFDRDVFKKISPKADIQFKYLKDINKNDTIYRRLSNSQKQITDLINDYDKHVHKIKDNYLMICREKIRDKNDKLNYDFQIVKYKNYKTKSENKINTLLNKDKYPYGKNKGKSIKKLDKDFIKKLVKSNHYLKNKTLRNKIQKYHKKTIQSFKKKSQNGGKKTKKRKSKTKKRKSNKKIPLYYFWMNGCGWCENFNPTWELLTEKFNKKINMIKYEMDEPGVSSKLKEYNVTSFPTIILVKNNKPIKFDYDERSLENFKDFFTKHNVKMD